MLSRPLTRLCPSRGSSWNTAVAALLAMAALTACVNAGKLPKPGNPPADLASGLLHPVSAQAATSTNDRNKHIVLPNPALMGCKTGNCTQVLPDKIADPDAACPWQVSVDITGDKVIGLTALYDQPITIDDLQAAVDEHYGQWSVATFRTGPVRIWRVEPQKFVIQLAVADSGMVQLIFLTLDAKHPMSDQAQEYLYCSMKRSAECVAPRRWYQTLISPLR
jgi:hypothetical protein